MNNQINRILLYTKSVTNFQKWALIVFSACMAIDVVVTVWGYLFYDGFQELNPVFNQFFHDPVLFIGSIAILKSLIVLLVVGGVMWFNKKELSGEISSRLRGGDIISATSAGVMVISLISLVIINMVYIR